MQGKDYRAAHTYHDANACGLMCSVAAHTANTKALGGMKNCSTHPGRVKMQAARDHVPASHLLSGETALYSVHSRVWEGRLL